MLYIIGTNKSARLRNARPNDFIQMNFDTCKLHGQWELVSAEDHTGHYVICTAKRLGNRITLTSKKPKGKCTIDFGRAIVAIHPKYIGFYRKDLTSLSTKSEQP